MDTTRLCSSHHGRQIPNSVSQVINTSCISSCMHTSSSHDSQRQFVTDHTTVGFIAWLRKKRSSRGQRSLRKRRRRRGCWPGRPPTSPPSAALLRPKPLHAASSLSNSKQLQRSRSDLGTRNRKEMQQTSCLQCHKPVVCNTDSLHQLAADAGCRHCKWQQMCDARQWSQSRLNVA